MAAKLLAVPKGVPLGELSKPQALTEGVSPRANPLSPLPLVASSSPEGAPEPSQSRLTPCQLPRRGSFCGYGKASGKTAKCPAAQKTPSQALPRQLPQGGSQAVWLVAKILGAMRNFPAVLLALPLGELSP